MRKSNVSQANRQRVVRAVSETHAVKAALDEIQGRSRRPIGLIVADAENPFSSLIVGPIESVAYDTKRGLIVCNSDEDPDRERYHLDEMRAHGVDGVIVLPVGRDATAINSYRAYFPIVALDRRLPDAELDLAIVDNVRGSDLAVEHLAGLGHASIGLVAGHHYAINVERIGGFERALTRFGLASRPEYIRRGSDAGQVNGYEQTLHLMRLPQRPTAILALNHLMTLGVMLAVRDSGLRIPDDVSLVGFDEAPWARLLDPALTTVSQPAAMLGLAAATLLLDRIEQRFDGAPREVMLQPTLTVRGSTGAPRS